MARSSGQKSTAKARRSSSKRRISSEGGSRASAKRAKHQSSTSRHEKEYEEEDSVEVDDASEDLSEEGGSDFEDEGVSGSTTDEDEDLDDDDFDDGNTPKSRRNRNSGSKKNTPGSARSNRGKSATKLSAKELLKPGIETGMELGTRIVIKKPKARDAGTTPYADETIHPNTMLFLQDLTANNNRQWLKSELSLLSSRPTPCWIPSSSDRRVSPQQYAERRYHVMLGFHALFYHHRRQVNSFVSLPIPARSDARLPACR